MQFRGSNGIGSGINHGGQGKALAIKNACLAGVKINGCGWRGMASYFLFVAGTGNQAGADER